MDNLIHNNKGFLVGVENPNEADWLRISRHEKLSKGFMREYQHLLDWNML